MSEVFGLTLGYITLKLSFNLGASYTIHLQLGQQTTHSYKQEGKQELAIRLSYAPLKEEDNNCKI